MSFRVNLEQWIIDALRDRGGSETITDVARYIWQHHEREIRSSDNHFFDWQYEMRWAARRLRQAGKMKSAESSPKGQWMLS